MKNELKVTFLPSGIPRYKSKGTFEHSLDFLSSVLGKHPSYREVPIKRRSHRKRPQSLVGERDVFGSGGSVPEITNSRSAEDQRGWKEREKGKDRKRQTETEKQRETREREKERKSCVNSAGDRRRFVRMW